MIGEKEKISDLMMKVKEIVDKTGEGSPNMLKESLKGVQDFLENQQLKQEADLKKKKQEAAVALETEKQKILQKQKEEKEKQDAILEEEKRVAVLKLQEEEKKKEEAKKVLVAKRELKKQGRLAAKTRRICLQMSRIVEVKALMNNPSFALHLDGVKQVREEGEECVSKRYALTRELEDRECRQCLPSKKYQKIWDRTPKFAKQQIKWLLRGRKLTRDDQLDIDIAKALRSIRFSNRKPGKGLEEGDTLACIQLRPGSPGSSEDSEDSEDDQVQKESQEEAAPMHQVQEVRGEEPPLIVAPEEKEEDESESEEEPAAQVLVINGQLPEDDVEEEEDDPLGGATTDSLLGSSSDEEEQERDEEEQEHDEEEQEQGEEEREQVEEEMDQEDAPVAQDPAPVDKMDLDN